MSRELHNRQRWNVALGVGLFAAVLLVVSSSEGGLPYLRHEYREVSSTEGGLETPSHQQHRRWSFFRRLAPLSRDEVHAIIFEHHNEPYPDKQATFSPKPTFSPAPGTTSRPTSVDTSAPTLSPNVTIAPTNATTPTTAPGTFAPTLASEPVEAYLTRVLTDDGSLQVAGTPQNQALASFNASYPEITVVNSEETREFVETDYALRVLYYSTGGDLWRDRTGWNGATPPCGDAVAAPWFGISCTGSTVSSLALPDNDLVGNLPSELRGLGSMQSFDLASNSLSGSLPATLGELSNITSLELDANFLTGTLPSLIAGATSLQTLSLGTNQIAGTIPIEINGLFNLERLDLNSNLLEGTVPPLGLTSLGK